MSPGWLQGNVVTAIQPSISVRNALQYVVPGYLVTEVILSSAEHRSRFPLKYPFRPISPSRRIHFPKRTKFSMNYLHILKVILTMGMCALYLILASLFF